MKDCLPTLTVGHQHTASEKARKRARFTPNRAHNRDVLAFREMAPRNRADNRVWPMSFVKPNIWRDKSLKSRPQSSSDYTVSIPTYVQEFMTRMYCIPTLASLLLAVFPFMTSLKIELQQWLERQSCYNSQHDKCGTDACAIIDNL